MAIVFQPRQRWTTCRGHRREEKRHHIDDARGRENRYVKFSCELRARATAAYRCRLPPLPPSPHPPHYAGTNRTAISRVMDKFTVLMFPDEISVRKRLTAFRVSPGRNRIKLLTARRERRERERESERNEKNGKTRRKKNVHNTHTYPSSSWS